MAKIIERAWSVLRIPIVIMLFILAGLMLYLWNDTDNVRHGLLACALACYAIAFLNPGTMTAVNEKRLLKFEPISRNALLLATGLSAVSAIMVFMGK